MGALSGDVGMQFIAYNIEYFMRHLQIFFPAAFKQTALHSIPAFFTMRLAPNATTNACSIEYVSCHYQIFTAGLHHKANPKQCTKIEFKILITGP